MSPAPHPATDRVRARDRRVAPPARGSRARCVDSAHARPTERRRARAIAQHHFLAGLDRFVDRVDDLDRLAPLESVHERGTLAADRADHVLEKRLVPEAIDVVGYGARLVDHALVLLSGVLELPGRQLVDGEAADHDGAALAEDR